MSTIAHTLPKQKTYLIASLVFVALAAGFLALVKYLGIQSLTGQVSAVLAGMSVMGALSCFRITLERSWSRRHHVAFDEDRLRTSIAAAFEGTGQSESRKGPRSIQQGPRTVTAVQLVGADNVLALARVRIDLESELRRIAARAGVASPDRLYSVTDLINLTSVEGLPAGAIEPLREMIEACDRGIHGAEVSDKLATSITRVADQLLEKLQMLPVGKVRKS